MNEAASFPATWHVTSKLEYSHNMGSLDGIWEFDALATLKSLQNFDTQITFLFL
jgi:hypothetical protein